MKSKATYLETSVRTSACPVAGGIFRHKITHRDFLPLHLGDFPAQNRPLSFLPSSVSPCFSPRITLSLIPPSLLLSFSY